jgi:predicted NBD/HSP70 family sugar kinase
LAEEVLTTPAFMRRHNTTSVLKAVRRDGPLSRSDIAKRTGLSKPTVNDIVTSLLSQNYLRETDNVSDRQERTGPRASQLTFAADVAYVLGVDLSFYKVVVSVTDLNGSACATETLVLRPSHRSSAKAFIKAVNSTVDRTLDRANLSRKQLWAVGIGVPGAFDASSGAIKLAPTLARWSHLPLGAMLRDLFECPVLIENEVHLSVLAEQRWGGAVDICDAVYFHAGIGLALGLLIRGEIYRGAEGIAGEIGYMVGPNDDPGVASSDFGPFEWAAGGLAFARLAREAVASGAGDSLLKRAGDKLDRIDAKLVFEAARDNDPTAQGIVATITERLAIGVANICCILNPAVVILGAGLSQAGADLLEPLKARVAALIPMPPRDFIVSELGPRAVILGAVEHALRAVEDARFNLFADVEDPLPPTQEAALA